MKLTQRFGPIPLSVTLDGTGYGVVTFQPNGSNARVTNLFVKVSTTTSQATCTIYKGQISDGNAVNTTNSGSTGSAASGAIDLTDGEVLYVVWRGGDAGATATATFTGITIPFDEVGPSALEWADPIAAGDGSLVYPALKSPNYVAGTSGWKIDRDGDAEFNDIDVRGSAVFGTPGGERIELTDAGDLEIYTAGGALLCTINELGIKFFAGDDLVAWIDSFAITFQDNLGNSIDITTDASFGAEILFNTADPVGIGIDPGRAYATTFAGQNNAPVLVLQSPYMSLPTLRDYARIYIIGEDGAANPAKIDFRTGGGPVSVLDGADLIVEGNTSLGGDLTVQGIRQQFYLAKSAAQNFTNTITPANVTGMSFTADPNATYLLSCRFAVGGPTAADVRLSWTVPAGANMSRNILAGATGLTDNTNASMVVIRRGATTQQTGGTSGGTANDFTGWWEDTILEVGATGGTVQLQGAQGTANATPTVFQSGSYMLVERIA